MIPAIMKLLEKENTGIVIIDVQEKLMEVMAQRTRVIENIGRLLYLAQLFDLPIILTEHYRKWLGPTLPAIVDTLTSSYNPIQKMHFNDFIYQFTDQLK